MRVLLPVIPNDVCNEFYKNEVFVSMFCAGYLWGVSDSKYFCF